MNRDDPETWIEAYLEGTATPEMVEQLDRALSKDEALRLQFLHAANLEAELSLVLCGEDAPSEFNALEHVPEGVPTEASVHDSSRWKRLRWPVAAILSAAVPALFLTLFHLSDREASPRIAWPSSLQLIEGLASFGGEVLRPGEPCEAPGRILAGTDTTVVLQYPDGSRLTLEEGTALRLESGPGKKVFLEQGALVADMQPQKAGEEMIMDTPNATVTVLGTRYRLETTIIEDLLQVEHGKVRLLEKRTNRESIATHGSASRIPGVVETLFPTVSEPSDPPGAPQPPYASYTPNRSWFTEDFDRPWSRGLWEIRVGESPHFRPWVQPEPGASIVVTTNFLGNPTRALRLSRTLENRPSVCLRLSETVGWDSYFLKFYYRPSGEEPAVLNPLCLELPQGTQMETIFQAEGPELFEDEPDRWKRVFIQYLRYWDGRRWQVEMRRYVNHEHRSTMRLGIGRTPAIRLDLTSGTALFDFVSVGKLNPASNPFKAPFENWLCTEDFEPFPHPPLWDVRYHDEEKFYPITAPGREPALQRTRSRKGKLKQTLPMANPSRTGIPSQLRMCRRIKWDAVLTFDCRPTGDGPLQLDPLCLQLPAGSRQELVFGTDRHEVPDASGSWHRVKFEYRRLRTETGAWAVEARRFLDGEHTSTVRIHIDHFPPVNLAVQEGAGQFDWIKVNRLKSQDRN